MTKALELLKSGIIFMKTHKELNPHSREHLDAEIALYNEAIAELEAPLTCSTCSHREHSHMYNNCNHPDTEDGWACSTFYNYMVNYHTEGEK